MALPNWHGCKELFDGYCVKCHTVVTVVTMVENMVDLFRQAIAAPVEVTK
jgi:hypothetical protein